MTKTTQYFAALALALGAATASAAPISLAFGASGHALHKRDKIAFGAISDQYSFNLATSSVFSLMLQTGGKNANDVVFSQVYLTHGAKRIDLLAPDTTGFEIWELPSQILDGGDWVLHVEGQDTIHKSAGAYQLQANHHVPVPATLALTGLGLAGLAWTRRRRSGTSAS